MASLSVAELGILNWIQTNCHNEFWDEVMPVLTSLGNGGLIWIALAVAILLLQRGKRGTGLQVLIALLLSLVLCNLLLKNAVDRVRPFDLNQMVQLLVPEPQDPSFPSGHTSASFAAVTVLFLHRWKGRWPALALAGGIGFSRMYLYLHFLTDVLGGVATGVFCGWLAATLWQKWISPHWPETPPDPPKTKNRTVT